MMFTPTNDAEDPISFMDPYSSLSLLSPLSCFEMDGSLLCYHDQSLKDRKSIAQPPAESSNEPISTSKKMDLNKGDIIGTVDQDNGRSKQSSIKQISRRRSSKGDRHSKIPTAKGLRDRRMRLSLDVARQFFKLQDMLGCDKPSKTIKWLLLQAKSAIEELKETKESPGTNGTKSAPSTSEGEVVESTIEEEIAHAIPKATTSKHSRNAFHPVAKELRKKARQRARERTLKKKLFKVSNDPGRHLQEVINLHQYHVRPKGTLELGEESSSHSQNQQIQDERNSFGTTENFTGTSLALGANWSPLMSLNYHQEDETCQVNLIPEFQIHGASWEPYSHLHVCQYWPS